MNLRGAQTRFKTSRGYPRRGVFCAWFPVTGRSLGCDGLRAARQFAQSGFGAPTHRAFVQRAALDLLLNESAHHRLSPAPAAGPFGAEPADVLGALPAVDTVLTPESRRRHGSSPGTVRDLVELLRDVSQRHLLARRERLVMVRWLVVEVVHLCR